MIDAAPVNIVHALSRALQAHPYRLRFTEPKARIMPSKTKIHNRMLEAFESPKDKARRVKRELLDAGASLYGLLKSESRYLPKVLHENEYIEAAIYGQHNSSSAMMIATDERIVYLDKKPMVEMFDEVSYEVISGIEFDIHTFFATIVLHTPVRNYEFKYVNLHCAEKFARHIEKHRLEREPKDYEPLIELLPPRPKMRPLAPNTELKDMAGYYWLPTEEAERLKVQQTIT